MNFFAIKKTHCVIENLMVINEPRKKIMQQNTDIHRIINSIGLTFSWRNASPSFRKALTTSKIFLDYTVDLIRGQLP